MSHAVVLCDVKYLLGGKAGVGAWQPGEKQGGPLWQQEKTTDEGERGEAT